MFTSYSSLLSPLSQVLRLNRPFIRRLWIFFWGFGVVCELFIIFTTVYMDRYVRDSCCVCVDAVVWGKWLNFTENSRTICQPSKFKRGNAFYELSIALATGLSLATALGQSLFLFHFSLFLLCRLISSNQYLQFPHRFLKFKRNFCNISLIFPIKRHACDRPYHRAVALPNGRSLPRAAEHHQCLRNRSQCAL